MKNKVLVQLIIPEIDKKYDVLLPINKKIGNHSYDLVTCNPPYFKIGDHNINPNDRKAIARHEVLATLDDIVKESKEEPLHRVRKMSDGPLKEEQNDKYFNTKQGNDIKVKRFIKTYQKKKTIHYIHLNLHL